MKLQLNILVKTAVLAALAIALQSLNLPQPVTGPGINAVLYVAALYVNPLSGVLVGLVTPWIALMVGILKFAPAVPVIMAGNAALALSAGYLARVNRYFGMGLAAVIKFAVMTLGMKCLVWQGTKVPPVAYTALTTTQLFTALGGAVVALVILEALGRLTAREHGRTPS